MLKFIILAGNSANSNHTGKGRTSLKIILASGSPQRQQLLRQLGLEFEVVKPDESAECGICSSSGPAGLVMELAISKAADVAARLQAENSPVLLIACDTLAECDGEVLGKPRDEDHAGQMLKKLRGRTHRVYSGLCLWPMNVPGVGSLPATRVAVSTLKMDDLPDGEIDDYLTTGLWRGKAGAFGIQDRVGWLEIVEGSESNVIGLPLELLHEMLAEHGISTPNGE